MSRSSLMFHLTATLWTVDSRNVRAAWCLPQPRRDWDDHDVASSLRGFRSSLAVLELLFEPVGSVTGAAAFQQGYQSQWCPGFTAGGAVEPVLAPAVENFFNTLWSTAVDRLEEHAREVGADGVIGVSVDHRRLDADGWQLRISGTAVRVPHVDPPARPFLSALRMSEFLTLLLAGWVPTGLLWGNAAVHVHAGGASPWWQGVSRVNAEMRAPTDGVNAARTRAQSMAQAGMTACSAQGAVGMALSINRASQSCRGSRSPGMLITAHATATGIVRYRDPVVAISTGRRLSDGTRV